MRQRNTLHSIQGLRALAAWSVVVHHYVWVFGAAALPAGAILYDRMRVGVDVFFVISGLVMATTAGSSPRAFVVRRVARIVPVYWLTTALVALVIVSVPALLPRSGYSPGFLAQSLFFVPAQNPSGIGLYPVNTVGWTLNFEAIFYALIALALFVPLRWRWLLVGTGILALQRGLLGSFYTDPIIYEFLLGVVAAQLWRRGAVSGPAWAYGLIAVAALLVIGLMPFDATIRPLAWGLPCFGLVCACLRLEPYLRFPLLTRLGDKSYAVYLLHLLVLSAGLYSVEKFGWNRPLVSVACIGVIAGLSTLSYRYFEAPVRKWARERILGPAVPRHSALRAGSPDTHPASTP